MKNKNDMYIFILFLNGFNMVSSDFVYKFIIYIVIFVFTKMYKVRYHIFLEKITTVDQSLNLKCLIFYLLQ